MVILIFISLNTQQDAIFKTVMWASNYITGLSLAADIYSANQSVLYCHKPQQHLIH
jgi:hypothetical protein